MRISDKKILIIDDDEAIRLLLGRVIETAGGIPLHADGVQPALPLIQKENPDVIVLDLNMPGYDGFSFLQARRKMPLLAPIPVIVLSGRRDKNTIAKAMAMGADHYLEKPFEAKRILQTLRFVFHSRENLMRTFEPDKAPSANCRATGSLIGRGEAAVRVESPVRFARRVPVALVRDRLACRTESNHVEFHDGLYRQRLEIIADGSASAAPPSDQAQKSAAAAAHVGPRPLALILDDDVMINRFLEAKLAEWGFETSSFTEPQPLLDAVGARAPALLVLDLNLGQGLSGFDVIQQIRNQLKSHVPILISSGDRKETSFVHALELGANEYVTKPLNAMELQAKVEELLRESAAAAGPEAELAAVPSEQRSIELDFRVRISEISAGGAKLVTQHLVRKGTPLSIYGGVIKEMLPERDKVDVSVVTSANVRLGADRAFQLTVQFDEADEPMLAAIRTWIARPS